jgi:hypothetical protein
MGVSRQLILAIQDAHVQEFRELRAEFEKQLYKPNLTREQVLTIFDSAAAVRVTTLTSSEPQHGW